MSSTSNHRADGAADPGEPPDEVLPEERPVPEAQPDPEEYEPVDPDPEAIVDGGTDGPADPDADYPRVDERDEGPLDDPDDDLAP